MICKNCGNQISDGAAFCTRCGAAQSSSQVENLDRTVGAFDEMPKEPTNANPGNNNLNTARNQYVSPTPQPNFQAVSSNSMNNTNTAGGKPSVTFGEAIKLFFVNYVNFTGRSTKSEYWWVFLFNIILMIPNGLISSVVAPIGGLISVALMIPGLALFVRRMHDIGKCWYRMFIGLIPIAGAILLIIDLCKDSDGDNQWGIAPQNVSNANIPSQMNTYGNQVYSKPVQQVQPEQKKAVSDNDIVQMAYNHEPIDFNSDASNALIRETFSKIIPMYTGVESLSSAFALGNVDAMKTNINALDNDLLLVAFKTIGYKIGQGDSRDILGPVQNYILYVLKTRF